MRRALAGAMWVALAIVVLMLGAVVAIVPPPSEPIEPLDW